jgi:hypothetical protein
MDDATYEGIVERRRVGGVSKSAHDAVVLVTASQIFLLRRAGSENPWSDPALEELVGKRVRAQGTIVGPTLVLTEWEEHAEPAREGET